MNISAQKALRFSIGEVFKDGYQEEVCVKMSKAMQRALLHVVERFYWKIWLDETGVAFDLVGDQMSLIDLDVARLAFATSDCGVEPDIVEIEKYIFILKENMVNNMCGCCCGGDSTSHQVDDWMQNNGEGGGEPLPGEPIGEGEQASNICGRAAQYANGYVEVMSKMKSTFTGISATVAAIDAWIGAVLKWEGTVKILSRTAMAYLMQGFVALVLATQLTDQASDAAQQYEEQMKCAVAGATSSIDAKARFMAVLKQIKEQYNYAVYALFWVLATITNWDALYYDDTIAVQPSFVNADCSNCQGFNDPTANDPNDPPPDPILGTIEWRDGVIAESTPSTYTIDHTIGASDYDYSFHIPTTATTWSVGITATKPTLAQGESIVGFHFFILHTESNGGVNDPVGMVKVGDYTKAGDWRYLQWLSGYQTILEASLPGAPDVSLEKNGTTVQASPSMSLYARVGTGQTPPGAGNAQVVGVKWAVKVA